MRKSITKLVFRASIKSKSNFEREGKRLDTICGQKIPGHRRLQSVKFHTLSVIKFSDIKFDF